MRSVLIAAALLTAPAPACAMASGIWKACSIDSVSVCAPAGCSTAKPAISIFVSNYVDHGSERSAYYRCGLKLTHCDRYSAIVNRNGDFIVFSLPQHSLFAKLGGDGRITDVAGQADSIFVSRGKCTDAAPPPDSSLRSR
jgi:hypothetical protein